ncbi:MAG: hypothetical protein QHH07_11400, partial [Sedimentisphaerales bacterium]|nr:hypothetical protein [Sedimentisphaerales bacterium]
MLALLFCHHGCATVRVTDPQRTATEQFLMSEAAIAAIKPISFEPLRGRRVFIDETYLAISTEKAFVLGQIRARLLESGALLAPKREQAEVILEVRSGGIGIDRYESLIGLPSFGSGTAATSGQAIVPLSAFVTPEIAITKEIKQVGFASIAYVAYWADTGQIITSWGPSTGKAYRADWWLLGFGPRTVGTIVTIEHQSE